MKKRILALFMTVAMLCLSACAAPAPAPPSESGAAQSAPSQPAPAPAATAPAPPSGINPGASAPWDGNGGYAAEDSLSGERYLEIEENQGISTGTDSLITFSLKVDTAAYSNVERYINSYTLPPKDAVRTEELINYFHYEEAMPSSGDHPFSIYTEIGPSPLDANKYMAMVRVKSNDIPKEKLPPSNLTFLIDTSGSMNSYDKLPLLQQAFRMLVETLGEEDVVSIVTYAGSAGVALDSVHGGNKQQILRAIGGLTAGGSTAGAAGIETAYALAEKNYMPGGSNRIILASDGDFNVGISNVNDLKAFISKKRQSGLYLSVLGFGTGNTRDDIMETLAANGNGNYFYINSIRTAEKVLVDEITGNLFTLAEDVKAQVEFNPANVASYRLIGYENRMLSDRDFENDKKDAGEIGVGTDVVALFELTLTDSAPNLKYGGEAPRPQPKNASSYSDELLEVRLRYKHPGESESSLLTQPVTFLDIPECNSADFTFAVSLAAFGEMLRGSAYAEGLRVRDIIGLAEQGLGRDTAGYRMAHLQLLQQYAQMVGR